MHSLSVFAPWVLGAALSATGCRSQAGTELKRPDPVAATERVAELSQRVRAGVEPSVLRFDPGPARDLEPNGKRFDGPVFLLADAGCGSSCENAVFLLRQLPNVTVVGEPTAGAIHFGQSGRLVLPNSKIVVTIATQVVRYVQNVWWEKQGFPPDVRVAAGSDALTVALEQLESVSPDEATTRLTDC